MSKGIKVKNDGLLINGKLVPLISGAMHYFRVDRNLWSPILDKFKGMGFGIIETYIPWSVHEIKKGKFDFGNKAPEKNLDAFLSLCEENGLYILVRPGPHINAEITYFGYPKRLFKNKKLLSRSNTGTPVILPYIPRGFPVPSYASEEFWSEVSIYFETLCPILKPHLYPNGGIIAIQADNEMSMFFRTGAYDHDYSDGAKELYYSFLREKYNHEIDSLNRVYSTNYSSFDSVPMARGFDAAKKKDVPYYLDWMEYKEHYIIKALERVKGMLRSNGISDIPVFHNYPGFPSTPFDIKKTEDVIDIQGFDIYPQRRNYEIIKKWSMYTSVMSRLPFIPEFSSGFIPWAYPLSLEDQLFTTKAAFMFGIKAINFYMIVERERWYGSPITRDGRVREAYYEFFKGFNSILKETSLCSMKRDCGIMLMINREYDRLEKASNLFSQITPMIFDTLSIPAEFTCSEDTIGFSRCIQIENSTEWEAWYRALTLSKYPFAIGDTSLELKNIITYKMLIIPTFDFMSRSTQEVLVEYVKKGGVLVLGPAIPEMDEVMGACDILAKRIKGDGDELIPGLPARIYNAGKGSIVLNKLTPKRDGRGRIIARPDTVELIKELAGKFDVKRRYYITDQALETSLFFSAKKEVLFVANPTDKKKTGTLKFNGEKRFVDLWSKEKIAGKGEVEITLNPFTVKMYSNSSPRNFTELKRVGS